jgi:hypothetical protein
MAMSPNEEVLRMRLSNRRRCASNAMPTKQNTPAAPPTTMASNCLKPCEMPSASNSQIGVSRPAKWPRKITSTPTWNRLEPHISWRRRRSWLEPLRQLYCSRSKRTQLPTRNTVRQK